MEKVLKLAFTTLVIAAMFFAAAKPKAEAIQADDDCTGCVGTPDNGYCYPTTCEPQVDK